MCVHTSSMGHLSQWLSYCIIKHKILSMKSKQTAKLDCQPLLNVTMWTEAYFQLHTTGYWW